MLKKKEEIYDGKNLDSQELYEFMCKYYDWENTNEVVWVNDIDRILNKDYDNNEVEWLELNQDYLTWSREDLEEEQRRMFQPCFESAYAKYEKQYNKMIEVAKEDFKDLLEYVSKTDYETALKELNPVNVEDDFMDVNFKSLCVTLRNCNNKPTIFGGIEVWYDLDYIIVEDTDLLA